MTRRIPSLLIVAIAVATLVIAGASCDAQSSQQVSSFQSRFKSIERNVASVRALAGEVSTQIEVLETADQNLSTELGALRTSIDELKKSIDSLNGEVQAARAADSALGRRVDALSAKVDGIDQRLWVLEARYTDHLKKYHSGG